MIKNAIKAVTLYTMTGLTIRRPTISKNRHLLVFFNYTPMFFFQRQTDVDVRPLPYEGTEKLKPTIKLKVDDGKIAVLPFIICLF